ncbi:hypothetical protein JHK87_015596 [Glycine soja]|nr:hypothetical protein JHK87_015596 [Glycine soja]
MAFLWNKTSIASHFRSHSQKTEGLASFPRRRFHVEPGAREKALLAEDATLKPFKSYKKSVKQLRKIGNALTVVVVAVLINYNNHNSFEQNLDQCFYVLAIKFSKQLNWKWSEPDLMFDLGPVCDRVNSVCLALKDAVTKYMSELLQERKLRNCNVLKVLDEANIGS